MNESDNLYDVVIIGGGPAGLSAAIYLTRSKYRVLVLEREQFGGQITITNEVVNYPGVGKCSGRELTDTMYRQAEYFGAEFLLAEATGFKLDGDIKIVYTNSGEFRCFGVLLCTGAHPRMIGFKGEAEFRGRGVAYCATCDGEFFTGKEIFVVGGGYAAAEESVFLTKFASHVTVIMRGDDFSCAKTVSEPAKNNQHISIVTNTVVEEVKGDESLNYIRYKNTKTGEVTEYEAANNDYFGVFVFAGYEPETQLVKGIANLNEQGYIVTDKTQKTSVLGLYAAGDICIKPLRQVVTATSDGALAATELEKYVSSIHQKTGIYAKTPVINKEEESDVFGDDIKAQLNSVLGRMRDNLVIKLYPAPRQDSRMSQISDELVRYVTALTGMSDKLSLEIVNDRQETHSPCVKIFKDNRYTGLAFHGVPGGHEFTSFIMGLFNASGPGQPLDEQTIQRISRLSKPLDIKVLVTLSCSMCPDLVIGVQHIAAISDYVSAEVFDISHFDDLRTRYKIMSVPCMIINDNSVYFGKKNISQLLDILEEQ